VNRAVSADVVKGLVQVERHESITTLRLNRPERLNALNVELSQASRLPQARDAASPADSDSAVTWPR